MIGFLIFYFVFSGLVIGGLFAAEKRYSVVRGEEIRRWQEDNDACECPYVILDDDTDMLLWQKDNFVQTDSELGLSEEDCEKAIWILNKED